MAGHSRSKNGVLSHAYVPAMTGECRALLLARHARLYAGHPRLPAEKKDVDARDKRGHDGKEVVLTLFL
jgi:hypothetical protein